MGAIRYERLYKTRTYNRRFQPLDIVEKYLLILDGNIQGGNVIYFFNRPGIFSELNRIGAFGILY
jgi:hypothetical protein